MIGLALGVLAMIVVLSVMNGFQREMSSRILGMVPHATIVGVNPIDDWQPVAAAAMKNPEVTAAVPFTEMEGMLSYKGSMQPIQVSGVDPAQEGKVSIVAQHIVQGRLDALKPGEFGVVIGEITARRTDPSPPGAHSAPDSAPNAAFARRRPCGSVPSCRQVRHPP